MRAVETFAHVSIFPASLALGEGKYALDLGLNVYGLLTCTGGFLAGALVRRAARRRAAAALQITT